MRDRTLEIVPMRASDIGEVAEIERSTPGSPWPDHLFLDELDRDWAYIDLVRTRAAEGSSRVVGFCDYWLVHDEVQLLNLATHPAFRRQGVATMLLRHLVDFARAHDCRYVTLEVRASNHPAQELYRAHGFAAVGLRPRYYADNGEDAMVMTLDLGAD
jgi:[ribosomal protein S18]-alanine N-acetyltransferase